MNNKKLTFIRTILPLVSEIYMIFTLKIGTLIIKIWFDTGS